MSKSMISEQEIAEEDQITLGDDLQFLQPFLEILVELAQSLNHSRRGHFRQIDPR